MKFNIKEFNNFVTEESHFVDGTHISKNSEKILNTAAKFIYYASVISAIILIAIGIYAFVSCLVGAGMVIDNPFISGGDMVMSAFVGLFKFVLEGVGAFISGVIIYSLKSDTSTKKCTAPSMAKNFRILSFIRRVQKF